MPFTAEEVALVASIAAERQRIKDSAGVVDRRISAKKSSVQVHTEGLLAELAVAKVLGVSASLDATIAGDGRFGDLKIPDGRTISVKFTGQIGGDFALRSTRVGEFADDLGVLVFQAADTPAAEGLIVHGYCTRADFEAQNVVTDYGHGARLALMPEDMKPIEELMRLVSLQRGVA